MDVPFAVLESGDANGHLAALAEALADDKPGPGGSATEGAVRTLIAETAAHTPEPHRRTVAVLVTDGAPDRCFEGEFDIDAELQQLSGLFDEHYKSTGIPTFIVGMDGATGSYLRILAKGAGTDRYYSVGSGDPELFIAALESIRMEAIGCQYAVPEASVGLSDLDSLEVMFKPDLVSVAEVLEPVANEESCTLANQFWLNTQDEKTPIVNFCPATCQRHGPDSAIELSLLCEGS